jgi:trans-aconitate 2-methyltransferase
MPWDPDHADLLRRLTSMLTEDGTLAFQVPANHDQPSHRLPIDLCADEACCDLVQDAIQIHVREPDWYATELAGLQFEPMVWQTTYLHRLTGDDPVLDWATGTTLRPVLERLADEQTESFLREYRARLRRAYPNRDGITFFPFTRTFVVATKA